MLKVAIIGTGLIATQKHLPSWRGLGPRVNVVAVCDVDATRGQEFARKHGVPRAYTSAAEMLKAESPDIVDICTPPRTHAALAIEALEAGSHVFIEKPMAVSQEECDRIVETAKRTGRQVCVGHTDLFYPSFRELRKRVKGGEIGAFRGMHIFLSTPRDYITSKSDHWANKLDGGVLGETGPHIVYMALAFLGQVSDTSIVASKQLNEYPWSPYEDYRITFRGVDGTAASATLTYVSTEWAARVEVWGDRGILRADLETQAVVRHSRPDLAAGTVGRSVLASTQQEIAGLASTAARRVLRRYSSSHDLLFEEFVDSVRAGTPPPVTPEEGREAVRVMKMLTESLRPGNP